MLIRTKSKLAGAISFALASIATTATAADFQARPLSERFIEVTADLIGARNQSPEETREEILSAPEFMLLDGTNPLTIKQVDYSKQTVQTKPFGGYPTIRQRWVIEVAEALPEDKSFNLQVNADGLTDSEQFSFSADLVNNSIQANQVGYLPEKAKIAWAGNWTGRRGMPIESTTFEVRSVPGNQVAFTGVIGEPQQDDVWTGSAVHKLDFSAFSTPGTYRLTIPGVGSSHPFEIGTGIYEEVATKSFKVFLHHRDTNDLTSEYAQSGYTRPDGAIPQDLNAVYHPAIKTSVFANREKPERFLKLNGGWYDAGDYGQYIANAAPVWHYFSTAFDLAPSLWERDDMGIPESGNGLADMMDELNWGYQWASAMQDRDGGVYNRVVSECWDTSMPADITKPRYIYEKTTHATASFAALAAIQARLTNRFDSRGATKILKQAEAAWNFVEANERWPAEGSVYNNPTGTCAGEYQDSSSLDTQLWAAAELYRATGDTQYLDYYEAAQPGIHHDPQGTPTYRRSEMAAAWAYLIATQNDTKAKSAIRDNLMLRFRIGGMDRVKQANARPMEIMLHAVPMWVGWGTMAQSSRHTFPMLQSYLFSGWKDHYEWAFRTPDVQLGANPLNMSYITGVGGNYPMNPLSKLQRYSGNSEPIHGLPVNGPAAELAWSFDSYKQVNMHYEPQDRFSGSEYGVDYLYPVLRRYVDDRELPKMQEPTVQEYAYNAAAYAVLNELAQGRSSLSQ